MPKLLSEVQVQGYERDGYVSPIDVLSAAEVTEFRQDLEGWEKQRGPSFQNTGCRRRCHWSRYFGIPLNAFFERSQYARLCALAPRQPLFLFVTTFACDSLGGPQRCQHCGGMHASLARQPSVGGL